MPIAASVVPPSPQEVWADGEEISPPRTQEAEVSGSLGTELGLDWLREFSLLCWEAPRLMSVEFQSRSAKTFRPVFLAYGFPRRFASCQEQQSPGTLFPVPTISPGCPEIFSFITPPRPAGGPSRELSSPNPATTRVGVAEFQSQPEIFRSSFAFLPAQMPARVGTQSFAVWL